MVTGEQLDKPDEKAFEEKVEKISVYARVSPSHKLRIVVNLATDDLPAIALGFSPPDPDLMESLRDPETKRSSRKK